MTQGRNFPAGAGGPGIRQLCDSSPDMLEGHQTCVFGAGSWPSLQQQAFLLHPKSLLSFPFQVTEETCTILQGLGYSCECRGLINVKGKGELRTYFVCTDTAKFQGLGLN